MLYIIAALYLAWRLALRAYHAPVEEATSLAEATAVFSNIIFIAVLLMGFGLFMLGRIRKRLGQLL